MIPTRITGRNRSVLNPQQAGVVVVEDYGRTVSISYAELVQRLAAVLGAGSGSWIPLVTGEEPSDYGTTNNLVTDGEGGLILVWSDGNV